MTDLKAMRRAYNDPDAPPPPMQMPSPPPAYGMSPPGGAAAAGEGAPPMDMIMQMIQQQQQQQIQAQAASHQQQAHSQAMNYSPPQQQQHRPETSPVPAPAPYAEASPNLVVRFKSDKTFMTPDEMNNKQRAARELQDALEQQIHEKRKKKVRGGRRRVGKVTARHLPSPSSQLAAPFYHKLCRPSTHVAMPSPRMVQPLAAPPLCLSATN